LGRVGRPGFHGLIDIGDAPEPQLICPQPLMIKPAPGHVASVPIDLYVPANRARDWGRYCRRYDVCGEPVYFVSQDWYENVYVPRYRARYLRERRVYAHAIHSAVVRAQDVHAEMLFTRDVYRVEGEPVGSNGEDIHAPVVESGEIQAHDIHAHVIEADALYVHDLHVDR